MPVKKLRYRISRFGTVVLPQEVKQSVWCLLKLEIQATRGPSYYSRERIPAQTVHGWVTARDSDGYVVNRDWDWRFDKQRWLLWEIENYLVTVNQCFIANKQLEVLLSELAKKPNIPPLPPSLPVVNYDSFFGVTPLIIHGFESITVKTRLEADFDIEFVYFPREESRCSPEAEEIPRGPAPLEDELPKPGGENGIAPGPVFVPPVIPAGSPPIGGTSLIPEGYQGPDQSSPPNLPTDNQGQSAVPYSVVITYRQKAANAGPEVPFSQPVQVFVTEEGPIVLLWFTNSGGLRFLFVNDSVGIAYPVGDVQVIVDSVIATPINPPGPPENVAVPPVQ